MFCFFTYPIFNIQFYLFTKSCCMKTQKKLATVIVKPALLVLIYLLISQCFSWPDLTNDQPAQITITLPSNYDQTQINPSLHPIKIVPQFKLETLDDYEFQENTRKVFHIAAYYFSRILEVEPISPRSQTIFPADKKCFNVTIPTKYLTQGFDPNQSDLVIFVETPFTDWPPPQDPKNTVGVCLLQRRPLYGYMYYLYYHAAYRMMGQYSFHRNIEIMIHLMIHILAFNPIYFFKISNPVSSIILDQNYETHYFKDAYSSKRLIQKDVIRKHSQNKFIFKTPQIRHFVYTFFKCEGKSNIQNVGLLLKTYIYRKKTYIQYHFDQAQGISIDLMHGNLANLENSDYYKYGQHKMITIIELLLLKDSGFYEYVSLDTQFYQQLIPSSVKNQQFQYQIYDICTFQNLNLDTKCAVEQDITIKKSQCDIYGYTLRQTDGNCQHPSFYNCMLINLPDRRCILRDNFQKKRFGRFHNCNSAKCVKIQGKNYLYLNTGSMQSIGCGNGQENIKVEGTQLSFKCPQNIQIFCNAKTCSNFCSHEGLCIRGKCLIPPTPRKLEDGTPVPHDQKKFGYCKDNNTNQTYICPAGCLSCHCNNRTFFCLKTLSGFGFGDFGQNQGKYIEDIYQVQKIITCKKNTYQCLYYNQQHYPIRCYDKFFFSIFSQNWNTNCYKCTSDSCSACSDIYLSSRCTNCVQNQFINELYICQKCQGLDNCRKCFRKFKQKYICQECIQGYHLFNNVCHQCLPSCGKCNKFDFTICEGCFAGSFLANIPGTNHKYCQPCSQGCKVCSNFTFCQICIETYLMISENPQTDLIGQQNANQNLNSQQIVQFCVPICSSICVKCKIGKPDICQQCPAGYMLNESSNKCDVNHTYFQNGYPGFCPITYFYQENQQKCTPCDIKNCLFCEQGDGIHYCDYCFQGFYKQPQRTMCNSCPQQCQTCVQYDICLTCKKGFIHPKNIDGSFFKTQCVKCTHNCETCIQNTHICLTCLQGFKKIGLKCVRDNQQLFYNVTFQGNFQAFLAQYDYSFLIENLFKALQFQDDIQSTLLNMEEGSIKMWLRINYDQSTLNPKLKQKLYPSNISSQSSQNCLIFIQTNEKIKDLDQVKGFSKYYRLSQFTYQIDEGCSEQVQTYQRLIASGSQYGISPTVVIIIVIANLIVTIMIVIVVVCVARRKVLTITLKYQQLQSKQQYVSSSTLDQIKQAY